ncbi:pilus assembly protein [Vibrio lamellibrachiae]|uniref:TadE/TadG family type IV pilus assembly protein n=1 Tax=Vibrio lamellibrachiae TaxID=2910253 RepID=UPI003D0C283C
MKNKQSGVASIEFVIGFFAFWLMCMAWVEMSYMSYISSINDLAISEVAREAKKGSRDYMATVQGVLHRDGSMWNTVVDGDNFQVTIQYLTSVGELVKITDQCQISASESQKECGNEQQSSLAIYQINYPFTPIFSYFLGLDGLLSREMIVVQEYERSKFEV